MVEGGRVGRGGERAFVGGVHADDEDGGWRVTDSGETLPVFVRRHGSP